jgi:hypothetical protein
MGPDPTGTIPPVPPTADPSPVFVVGAMRSGTTLLRLMLNEHPGLAIPAESHFVAPLFRRFGPDVVLDGDRLTEAVDVVAGSPEWQRDFGHTEDELRAAVGDGPLRMDELLDRVFRLEIADTGKSRWGDKTPAYLHRVDQLVTCFPAAKVVCIVRDPRDVYLSLSAHGWVGQTTVEIAAYLNRCERKRRRWERQLPAGSFRTVRYEDLVLDTEPTLRSVCTFLDLPFAGEMRAFFRNANDNVQQWELDIGAHNKLLRPPSTDDVGRWRREGSRLAIAEVEAMTGDVLDAHGYPRRLPARTGAPVRLEARARTRLRRLLDRGATEPASSPS